MTLETIAYELVDAAAAAARILPEAAEAEVECLRARDRGGWLGFLSSYADAFQRIAGRADAQVADAKARAERGDTLD